MTTILLRGGGDLASGVALRLYRAGFRVIITELPQPLAVRRSVSFCEAIYTGQVTIEGVQGIRVDSAPRAFELAEQGFIPVLDDPQAAILPQGQFAALVDARLLKKSTVSPADAPLAPSPLRIGLGPGFVAGQNVHAVVETQRGHNLSRVYWTGSASADTAQPEGDPRRVLRAPVAGIISGLAEIGQHVDTGQLIAQIRTERSGNVVEVPILAPLSGVLRGLIHPGLPVTTGLKIGDIDPRNEPQYCQLVSDKALAIGGGVLEAVLGYYKGQFNA